jgi:hypothetical protein
MKIEEDLLHIPDLSVKEIQDIQTLKQGLDTLTLQKNDAKIKLELVDFMNSLN